MPCGRPGRPGSGRIAIALSPLRTSQLQSAPLADPELFMALAGGARLGPYEIVSALGAGGMGEVYEARDTRLDRSVAIKVLPHFADNPDARLRFEREARAISALQ